MQRLRNILIGTSAYSLFEDVNLELVPLIRDDFCGFHYGQFSTEYLKYAAGESKYNLLNRFGVEACVSPKALVVASPIPAGADICICTDICLWSECMSLYVSPLGLGEHIKYSNAVFLADS